MIDHNYKVPSDNLAQYCADAIDRQEVSHEFMMGEGYGQFPCCYFWRGDFEQEMGLDPWKIVDDFEYFAKPNTRVFVEKKHLIEVLFNCDGPTIYLSGINRNEKEELSDETVQRAFGIADALTELDNVEDIRCFLGAITAKIIGNMLMKEQTKCKN